MKIDFITTNPGKIARLEDALRRTNILDVQIVQRAIELPEPRTAEIRVIAEQKAIYARSVIQDSLVVEDSGFFIDSLNGFPRAFVNFALETIGIQGILRLVEGKLRTCEFRQCLVYTDPSMYPELQSFESVSPGTLAEQPRGSARAWELHKIFVPNDYKKTVAEMTPAEREEYRAARDKDHYIQFADWLKHHAKK